MFQIKLFICNMVLWLSLLPETLRYLISFLFPVRAQKVVLRGILAKMRIREEDFSHRPITKYDDYVGTIEAIRTTGCYSEYREEVLRLCPTSGTAGSNKLIPYTKSLKVAFQRGLYPWMFFVYLRFPRLFFSRQYWSVTPVVKRSSDWGASKIKIGFEDDEEYVGWLQRLITKVVWVNTKEIVDNSASVDIFLARLAMKLNEEKRLGLVSVWSPSLISLLVHKHGAGLLENLTLSSWAHGNSEKEAHQIAQSIGAQLQPKGLMSTEACVTFPVGKQTFLFSYNSHYFEFRDVGNETLSTVESLKVGHEYEVIVTTQSGFLRYSTGDIVRVDKFIFGRPSCVFVGRLGTVDLFGEKLDERAVEKIVSTFLREINLEKLFWFVAPTKTEGGSVAYTLFIETEVADKCLSLKFDELLRELYHYNYCRELGQLAQARLFVIRDTLPVARFIEASSHVSGARIGDVKMKRLSQKTDWHKVFTGYFV